MNVFFDTNVLLDVLANRKPFVAFSRRVWELSELNEINGAVSAISFNNLYYIVRKSTSDKVARDCLLKLRSIFKTVEVDQKILNQALDSKIKDFEDAIQFFCSLRHRSTYLLSRNPDDFPKGQPVAVATPEVFLNSWNSETKQERIEIAEDFEQLPAEFTKHFRRDFEDE